MATSKTVNQTVKTDFQQVGAEKFQQALKDMLLKIESIPKSVKDINPVVNKLATDLQSLAQSFAKNEVGTEQWLMALKEVQASIKTISTLSSGLKLFEKEDLKQLQEFGKEQRRIQKAAQEEMGRYANLRAKAAADEKKDLQEIANLRAKSATAPDVDTLLGKRQSSNYMDRNGWKDFSQALKNQMKEADDLTKTRQKQASGPEAIDRLLGIPSEEDIKKRSAASRAAFTEHIKVQEDYEKQRASWADARARYNAKQAADEEKANRPTASQRAVSSRLALSTGEGAASLLLIQGALMANSALLNSAMNSIQQTLVFSVQLEAAFRNVEAVIGTTKTEMIGLEDTIKRVSTTTKFSALEVAEASLTLGQAGLSAKQISESILPVVTLANAAGSSIANAVDLVTSVIGVFDKNASDVADVANKITQASNGSRVSVEKLALGFQYAGNTASQLGISFEEVTAAMAAMSNAGIKSGSTMGTGLRQFLVEVQKPSEDFLKILHRLGLSISDLDFRSKGFIGVIRTLKDAGFVASDAIQSFDVRGAAAFNALLARPDDLQSQYDSLGGSTAAMKANEIQMNSLSSQSSRLTNILGVMASTGFDPVVKAATGLVRTLGNGLNTVSEFSGGLQILGTVLAGLGAAAATAWLLPLLSGMARLLTMLPALVTGTAGVGAAMGGLSMAAGGVGLVVMAAVAAFTAFNYITGQTARSIDQAEAALSKAKGAAQEKDEAITSLNNRLEILKNRQDSLVPGTADFNTQVRESAELIARWGFNTDGATGSLAALAGRLREVRDEMGKMKLADLRQAATEATTVSNLREKELQVRSSGIQDRLDTGLLGGQRFSGQADFLKSLTPQQRSAAEKTIQDLASGKGADAARSGDAARLEGWLNSFRSNGNLGGTDRPNFDKFVGELSSLNSSGAEVRQANRARDSANATQNENEAIQNLKKRLKDQGLDLEDTFTGNNLAAQAKGSLPQSEQTNEIRINEETRKLVAQRRAQIEKATQQAMAAAESQYEKDYITTQSRSALERAGESLRSSAPAAAKAYDRESKFTSDDEELNKIKRRITRGTASQDEISRASSLLKSQGDRKFNKEAVGLEEGPDRSALRAATDKEVREQIEALQDSVEKAGASAASKALKSQEQSYRALIDAKMKDAKSSRGRATANTPMDDLSKLIDEGLEKIGEAKKLELESIGRQYGKGSIEYKNLTAAAEEKYTAAAQSFIGGFSGLIETVTTRISGISKAVKQTDAKIKKMMNDAEEEIYRNQEGIRANNLESSKNSGTVSGRRRSDVDAFYTSREREKLDLVDVGQRMAVNTVQTADISARKSDIETRVNRDSKLLEDLKTKRDAILNGRDTTELSVEDAAKVTPMAAQIAALEKEVTTGQSAVEGYTNKLQALRDTMNDLKNKQAGLTEGAAKPETWDSVANSMERVLDVYSKLINEQDTFKMLENGMLSAFQGISGSFSTFFTSVLTGTKSISQGFREMAANIIKSMMDVLAQALAMQAVKAILGAFMGVAGGAAGAAGAAGSGADAASTAGMLTAATGGLVTGGIPGKDSVPVMTMPGEYILSKTAVDVLGSDYVSKLNEVSANTVTSSVAPVTSANNGSAAKQSGGPKTVNVWVVTPDQMDQASVGPDDVVTVVADNIMRGGQLKKLVQSVSMGF